MRDSPTKKALPAEEEWPHTERAEHLSQYHITPVRAWNCVNNNGTHNEKLHFTLPSYQWHNRWVVATWAKRVSIYKSRISIKNTQFEKRLRATEKHVNNNILAKLSGLEQKWLISWTSEKDSDDKTSRFQLL